MLPLINSTIDRKNIDLAKGVYGLRQELDIYELISVNADKINERGIGKTFFVFLQNLAITSIAISICKIYEDEKKYDLYSIDGVFNLIKESIEPLDKLKVKDFILKYDGIFNDNNIILSLGKTIRIFREKYVNELNSFKKFRDKYAAHSDYGFNDRKLPSFDVMQKLFLFGADFCELVYRQFVGVIVKNLSGRDVKKSFIRVLKELGFENITTEMK